MLKKKMLNGIRVAGVLAIGLTSAMVLNACSEAEKISVPSAPDGSGVFENLDSVAVDVETGVIELPQGMDSVVVSSLASLGGKHFFIALDDDPVDPAFDWDNPLHPGSVISLKDNKDVRVVALDDDYRVVKIWTFSKPEEDAMESSSSEESIESSSSDEPAGSSSSEDVIESSSSDDEVSSSSEENDSSSSAEESSSSEISSSSVEISSSSMEESAESSSSDMVESSSSIEPGSSSSEVEESSSSEAIVSSSSEMLNEPQLPGSDFSSWDKSFWGSTSDVMAIEKTVAAIKLKSSANAEFSGSKMTLTTREIVGSFIGIEGSWKMAGGFYFAGTFADTDIAHLYQWNYTSGTPDASYASDISQGMTFGRPFSARPVSFDVSFAYTHVANSNEEFPQQGLIYVALVSADNKIVAAGSMVKSESSEMATETVELKYGSDAGLISAGYAGVSDLTVGSGNETVASIRVMFASSAYAFVVDGGALGNSGKYRGGENSKLVVDNFKLNY